MEDASRQRVGKVVLEEVESTMKKCLCLNATISVPVMAPHI
jgi:hypothetical protein